MSFVRIMVHSVWATKNREPILVHDKGLLLMNHILINAKTKNIFIDTIGGHKEHIHCLIGLKADQSIANIMQLIKGESANWANNEKLLPKQLVWGEDYFAASVSENAVDKVRKYIQNQEAHHKKQSFNDEYQSFLNAYLAQ